MNGSLADLMERHSRAFLAFSGGKESVVLAHMLEPWKGRITLLWVNTGFMAPHMEAFVRRYGERFAGLEVLTSASLIDHWSAYGSPAEVFTMDSLRGVGGIRLQPFVTCCAAIRQAPLDAFLKTQEEPCAFIVGQRQDDHGATMEGLEAKLPASVDVAMPLLAWSEADVFSYIERHGLDLPSQYAEGFHDSIECLVCPAPMTEARMRYLRRHHPHAATVAASQARKANEAAIRLMTKITPAIMAAE